MSQLIKFRIENFRGLVTLEAEPNGQSVTLRGRNGAGKSSAVDALYWALGGQLDGTVIRNGAEKAEVSLVFGDYLITRRQANGKPPSLTVKSADGKVTHNSPTALLSGFVAAIERQTFSHKRPSEQAKILRQLAPEIDTAALDAEFKAKYDERTAVNREAKSLAAQAAGVVVPDAPESVPEDEDLVAIASKKTDAERIRAENNRLITESRAAESKLRIAEENRRQALEAFERAKARLDAAEKLLADEDRNAKAALLKVKSLKEPDTSEIDADLARARETNRQRTSQRQLMRDAKAALDRKATLEKSAVDRQAESEALTARLEEVCREKAAQLAAAKLPIDGLSIRDETVMLSQAEVGPVEIDALNTAARMRLDVAIAAALGHRIVAVRDASLLDDQAELLAFAREKGVQLITEVVSKGEDLTVEVIEADAALV